MDTKHFKGIFLHVMVDLDHFSLVWSKGLALLSNVPNSLDSK